MESLDTLIDKRIAEKVAPLLKEINYLKASLPDEVDTKEAERLTGKTRQTLATERNRKGTKIRFTYKGSKVIYFRSSLIAYLESKGETPEGIINTLKAA